MPDSGKLEFKVPTGSSRKNQAFAWRPWPAAYPITWAMLVGQNWTALHLNDVGPLVGPPAQGHGILGLGQGEAAGSIGVVIAPDLFHSRGRRLPCFLKRSCPVRWTAGEILW